MIGAIFFIISDSLLAINKFYFPLPYSAFWIMSTYSFAQYFIVSGILIETGITLGQVGTSKDKGGWLFEPEILVIPV